MSRRTAKTARGAEIAVRDLDQTVVPAPPPTIPYTVKDIVSDDCFLSLVEIEGMLARLRDKMNLILQGPPRTGKT